MTDANKRANVASELGRADESMRAARVLVDAALLHDAESRLYYAIYHAAVALLLTEGLEPRSHAGTASMLGLHFVKTGRMDPEDARPHVIPANAGIQTAGPRLIGSLGLVRE